MMHRFMAAMLMCLVWPAAVSAGQAASPGIDEVFKKLESLSAKVESQQRLLNAQAEQIQLLKKQLAIQAQATAKAEIKADKAVEAGSRIPTAKEVLGDKFSLSTDLRLRYEGIGDRQSGNKELADRHRFRIRWRVFGGYQVTDELSLHSMLTTSSGSWYDNGKDSRNWQPGRTSNQSMDNEFNNKDVFVGRIYATYKPKWASGLELTGGKFKNTFLHTDIMWDPDVNPEGFISVISITAGKGCSPLRMWARWWWRRTTRPLTLIC